MHDDYAPFSRSAPLPSRLGSNMTAFGSHPHIELMSQSPPADCYHQHHHQQHHHQQQQQQQQRGRCRQQSASTTTFFREYIDDDVRPNSPPYSPFVLVPPPYSPREGASDSSPTRRLFAASGEDSPSPPLPSPASHHSRSPPWSPPLTVLRRNAASDNAVFKLTCCLSNCHRSSVSSYNTILFY